MTTPKSVLIVSFHAYPDPAVGAKRVSELANFLAGRGWQVTVAASDGPFQADGGSLAPQVGRVSIRVPRTIYSYVKHLIPDGLRSPKPYPPGHIKADGAAILPATTKSRIQRLREIYLAATTAVDTKKLWSLRLFGRLMQFTGRTRPSIVLVSGPYWSPVLATVLMAKLRKLPIVVDFRDPWVYQSDHPDHFSHGAIRRLNAVLESWCLEAAEAITCTTWSIAASIGERAPNVVSRTRCIRNGFDLRSVIKTQPPVGALRLLFAGTIYFNRNPLPLLEGLATLLKEPGIKSSKIELLMVGDCDNWKGVDLRSWCRDNNLGDRVRFEPPVSSTRIVELTANSNILVNFAQGQRFQVPAKVFEQVAALRTVLLFSEPDSETSRCIADLPSFIRLDDNPAQVRDALRDLYRRFVTEGLALDVTPTRIAAYSRHHSNTHFESVFLKLVCSQTRLKH